MTFASKYNPAFRSKFAEDIFQAKYAHEGAETWEQLAATLVQDVCGDVMSRNDQQQLTQYIADMKFIPGGRYLYYAGRPNRFYNNCYLLRAEEDTREDWANLSWKSESCLMTGGGIGVDYSRYRPAGSEIKRTGGSASGPIPKMQMINEIGRHVMQGGSRRSAIYASLNWQHADAQEFLTVKNWDSVQVAPGVTLADAKRLNFNFPAPLDMTNVSLNYDDSWLSLTAAGELPPTYVDNVRQALSTGEPGFAFNFGAQSDETLRNACTEVTSEDDSDVCNLGSVNFARIRDIFELADVTHLATKFLVCGSMKADLPYAKIASVREKNRRLGLGLMGLHEWLIKRQQRYTVSPELHRWLKVWSEVSTSASNSFSHYLCISRPIAVRAVAPTGTIGILAGTTTGIEPLFAVAYQRRYLRNGTQWHHQFVVDSSVEGLIRDYGADPETIESALDLAADPERRIKVQFDVQAYVDQAISSTINLPRWGTEANNEDHVIPFASLLARYASGLRGFTCYPDGARGGQPLTAVPYQFARQFQPGTEYREEPGDVCSLTKGGFCGS